MPRTKKNIEVIKSTPEPETDKILAEHITAISDAMKTFLSGPLKRDTIIMLIAESARVSRLNVRAVLSALEDLKKDYLK